MDIEGKTSAKTGALVDDPASSSMDIPFLFIAAVTGCLVLVFSLISCVCCRKRSRSDHRSSYNSDSRRDTVPLEDLLSKPSLADPESVFSELSVDGRITMRTNSWMNSEAFSSTIFEASSQSEHSVENRDEALLQPMPSSKERKDAHENVEASSPLLSKPTGNDVETRKSAELASELSPGMTGKRSHRDIHSSSGFQHSRAKSAKEYVSRPSAFSREDKMRRYAAKNSASLKTKMETTGKTSQSFVENNLKGHTNTCSVTVSVQRSAPELLSLSKEDIEAEQIVPNNETLVNQNDTDERITDTATTFHLGASEKSTTSSDNVQKQLKVACTNTRSDSDQQPPSKQENPNVTNEIVKSGVMESTNVPKRTISSQKTHISTELSNVSTESSDVTTVVMRRSISSCQQHERETKRERNNSNCNTISLNFQIDFHFNDDEASTDAHSISCQPVLTTDSVKNNLSDNKGIIGQSAICSSGDKQLLDSSASNQPTQMAIDSMKNHEGKREIALQNEATTISESKENLKQKFLDETFAEKNVNTLGVHSQCQRKVRNSVPSLPTVSAEKTSRRLSLQKMSVSVDTRKQDNGSPKIFEGRKKGENVYMTENIKAIDTHGGKPGQENEKSGARSKDKSETADSNTKVTCHKRNNHTSSIVRARSLEIRTHRVCETYLSKLLSKSNPSSVHSITLSSASLQVPTHTNVSNNQDKFCQQENVAASALIVEESDKSQETGLQSEQAGKTQKHVAMEGQNNVNTCVSRAIRDKNIDLQSKALEVDKPSEQKNSETSNTERQIRSAPLQQREEKQEGIVGELGSNFIVSSLVLETTPSNQMSAKTNNKEDGENENSNHAPETKNMAMMVKESDTSQRTKVSNTVLRSESINENDLLVKKEETEKNSVKAKTASEEHENKPSEKKHTAQNKGSVLETEIRINKEHGQTKSALAFPKPVETNNENNNRGSGETKDKVKIDIVEEKSQLQNIQSEKDNETDVNGNEKKSCLLIEDINKVNASIEENKKKEDQNTKSAVAICQLNKSDNSETPPIKTNTVSNNVWIIQSANRDGTLISDSDAKHTDDSDKSNRIFPIVPPKHRQKIELPREMSNVEKNPSPHKQDKQHTEQMPDDSEMPPPVPARTFRSIHGLQKPKLPPRSPVLIRQSSETQTPTLKDRQVSHEPQNDVQARTFQRLNTVVPLSDSPTNDISSIPSSLIDTSLKIPLKIMRRPIISPSPKGDKSAPDSHPGGKTHDPKEACLLVSLKSSETPNISPVSELSSPTICVSPPLEAPDLRETIKDQNLPADASDESDYDNPWDDLDDAVKRASMRYNRRPSRIAAGDTKMMLQSAEDLGRFLEEAEKKRRLRQAAVRSTCGVDSPDSPEEEDSNSVPFLPFTRFSPHRHTVKGVVTTNERPAGGEFAVPKSSGGSPDLRLLRPKDNSRKREGMEAKRPKSFSAKVKSKLSSPETKVKHQY